MRAHRRVERARVVVTRLMHGRDFAYPHFIVALHSRSLNCIHVYISRPVFLAFHDLSLFSPFLHFSCEELHQADFL